MVNKQIKSYIRRNKGGRLSKVKKHKRNINVSQRTIKSIPGGQSFKLPIQIAVIVPSTKEKSKPVTREQFEKRVNRTRTYLSNTFGGYTSIEARGGYYSKEEKSLIQERTTVVMAYSKRDVFMKKKSEFLNWVRTRGKDWGQESMGIIIENDMMYI